MAYKDLPCPTLLRQLLTYDPETGKLFWRSRTADMFTGGKHTTEHTCEKWNARYAGAEAFTAVNRQGYRCGAINNKQYKAHRIVWKLYFGNAPLDQIDHIDGNRTNNCISNLREVTNRQNSMSAARCKNNTSGYAGVTLDNRRGKYRSSIKVNRKQIFLGYFDCPEKAHLAYVKAKSVYGFSERHGT